MPQTKMMTIPIALFICLACGAKSSGPERTPAQGGASAQEGQPSEGVCPTEETLVALTYDDSMPTQIRTAAPALKAHGFRATFFLMDVRERPEPWAALKAQGHELAAHTFNHPCPGTNSWVPEGKGNEDYDLARMADELDQGLVMLEQLGETAPFTFAYPCGETWVGEDHTSYVPLIQERFLAARGATPSLGSTPSNIYEIPSVFLKTTGEELILTAESARERGGFVVFGFHGIGGDWETISEDAHETLLTFLDENRDRFAVLPFREAVACLFSDPEK